tara:strand:- start:77 stop:286 length:210 start_codon:yes stop_codon:yes gene_type:complete
MEKINEILIGTLTLVGGFLTKRIFSNHDALSDRITALEKTVVTKKDLARALDPIERNVDMILTNLLNKK